MSPYYYFFLIIFKNYNYRFWSSTEKNEFNSKITKRHKAVRTEGRYRENEAHRSQQQHCKNLRYLQSKSLSPYSKIKNANRGNPSVILSIESTGQRGFHTRWSTECQVNMKMN